MTKVRKLWEDIESKSALLLALIVSLSPFWRGLFFPADQLAFSIPIFLIGIVWFWRMKQSPHLEKIDWAVLGLTAMYIISNVAALNRYQALSWAIQYAALAILYIILSRELTDRPRMVIIALRIMTLLSAVVALIGLSAYTGLVWGLTDVVLSDRLTSTFQYPNTSAAFFNTGVVLCLLLIELSQKKWQKALYSGLYVLEVMAFFLCRSRIAFMQFPVILLALLLLVPWRHKLRILFIGGIITIIGMLVTNKLQELYLLAKDAGEIWNAGMGLGIRPHWSEISIQGLVWSLSAVVLGIMVCLVMLPLLERLDQRTPSMRTQRRVTYAILAATVVVGLLIASSIFVPAVSEAMRAVLSPFLPADLINAITNISSSDTNLTGRFMFIENGIRIGLDYPIFGTGGGGYASVYSRYQPIFSTSRFTHSQPFQVLSETGFPGFIAYLSMWGFATWMVLKRLWKSFQAETEKEQDPRHLLLAGLLPAIWAIGAHSTFDFDLTYVSMLMLVYALLAMIAATCWTGEGKRQTHYQTAPGRRKASSRTAPLSAYIIPILICIALIGNVPMLIGEQTIESLTGETNIATIIDGYENALKWIGFNSNVLYRYADFRIKLFGHSNSQEEQIAHLQRAYEVAETAVANDPVNPDPLYRRQLCYYYASDWSKGIDGAMELWQASPYWPDGLDLAAMSLNRAAFYLTENGDMQKLQEIAAVISGWKEIIEDPKHSSFASGEGLENIHLALATAKAIEHDYDAAEEYALQAAQYETTNQWALALLASIYQKQGRLEEANTVLNSKGMEGTSLSDAYKAMLKW